MIAALSVSAAFLRAFFGVDLKDSGTSASLLMLFRFRAGMTIASEVDAGIAVTFFPCAGSLGASAAPLCLEVMGRLATGTEVSRRSGTVAGVSLSSNVSAPLVI